MKKLLIIGNGFIGKNFYSQYSKKYDTTILTKKDIDILDILQIKSFFNTNYFDYIIYAIGMKDIKKCEIYSDQAYAVNGHGVLNILDCIEPPSKFVYISTDYVFDGQDGNYCEASITNPTTTYGKSKLIGEQNTSKYANSIIVRTSGVYGTNCLWFNELLDYLSLKKTKICFGDIYNTPTYVINLSEMIDMLFKIDFTGTIHLSGATRINRFDLYSHIATIFEMDKTLLKFGSADGLFPKDLSLDNNLYIKLTNNIPNNIIQGLTRLKNEY